MGGRHRNSIPGSGLGTVRNESAWGEQTATKRYGGSTRTFPSPADKHAPQKLGDENNLQGPRYQNIADVNSWVRGGGAKQAEGKPGFVECYKGEVATNKGGRGGNGDKNPFSSAHNYTKRK